MDKVIDTYILDCQDGSYTVYDYVQAGRGSVREGLCHNQFVDSFEGLEEAKAKYPKASVTHMKYENDPMPMNPPADFDPGLCGERWDDDY